MVFEEKVAKSIENNRENIWFSRYFFVTSQCEINPIYSPLKAHRIMNKTVKTVLKVLGYIIAALLGAAGEAVMM